VIDAKDAENAVLRGELQVQLERYRRLELRVAALERRLGSDSTTWGTPPSKDPIGARERRTAERKATVTASPSREPTMMPGGLAEGRRYDRGHDRSVARDALSASCRRMSVDVTHTSYRPCGGAAVRYVDVLDTGIG
jgi:transposase